MARTKSWQNRDNNRVRLRTELWLFSFSLVAIVWGLLNQLGLPVFDSIKIGVERPRTSSTWNTPTQTGSFIAMILPATLILIIIVGIKARSLGSPATAVPITAVLLPPTADPISFLVEEFALLLSKGYGILIKQRRVHLVLPSRQPSTGCVSSFLLGQSVVIPAKQASSRTPRKKRPFAYLRELMSDSEHVLAVSKRNTTGKAIVCVYRSGSAVAGYEFEYGKHDSLTLSNVARMARPIIASVRGSLRVRTAAPSAHVGIRLGQYSQEGPDIPFLLSEDAIMHHSGVFGITGSGKSTVTAAAIDQLCANGLNITVFDMKGEYAAMLMDSGLQHIKLDGTSQIEIFVGKQKEQVKGILFDVFANDTPTLTPGMAALLFDCLDVALKERFPLEHLYQTVRELSKNASPMALSALGLGNRISARFPSSLRKCIRFSDLSERTECNLDQHGTITLIDFTTLSPDATNSHVVQILWTLLVHSLIEIGKSARRKQIVVLEEATVTTLGTSGSWQTLAQLVLMGRSIGVAAWFVGQDATILPSYILCNLNNLILLRNRVPATVAKLGISKDIKELLPLLQPRQALVITKEDIQPSLVTIDNRKQPRHTRGIRSPDQEYNDDIDETLSFLSTS